MTIGTLSARILMDASGVRSGLGLTRAEMRLTRQAFLESTSDVEKLETALRTLEAARDKGAFASEEQYAAAVAAVRSELDPTVQAQEALTAAVEQQITTLNQQITTFGMSSEAITRQQLSQQGATAEQLEAVDALQQQLQALREQAAQEQRSAAAVEQMESRLREEIATRGMSADQIELWRLEQQGASQAAIAGVAALQREAAALREQDATAAAAAAEANKLEQEIEQLADSLRQEAATAGMSSDQIQIWRLQHAGASQASVQMIRQLQQQRTAAQAATGGNRQFGQSLQGIISGTGGAIPGVSSLTNSLQLGHPVLIAAAAAVGALVVAYKSARAALDWYVGGVKEALGSIDKLSKESRLLGTSVQDLRELRFAFGEIAGLDVSQTDKAIERLIKTIGEANAGGQEQSRIFQQLGVDSRQLESLGTREAMAVLADAMAGVTSQAERVRIASQLFGREAGVQMVNALSGGRAALEASAAAVAEYGGTISDLDAAQIEATNDAWGRVGMAVQSLTEQAAIELAPALQVAAEYVLELLSPEAASGQTLRMALQLIPPILAKTIDLADIVIGKFQQTQAGVMMLANSALQAAAAVDRAIASIVPGRETSDWLQTTAADFARATQEASQDAANRIARGMSGGASQRMEELAAAAREAAAAGEASRQASRETAAAGLPEEEPDWLRAPEAKDPFGLADAAARAATVATGQDDVTAAVDKLNDSLEEQIETWGMTADEAQLAALEAQGATQTELAYTKLLQEQVAQLKEQKEAADKALAQKEAVAKSVDDITGRLREQIDTWGMTADEAQLAKLAAQGANQDQLDDVRSLQEQLAELQRQKESLRATDVTIGGGSMAEAYDAIARSREAAVAKSGAAKNPAAEAVPITAVWQPLPPPAGVPAVDVPITAVWQPLPPPAGVPAVDVPITAAWQPLAPPAVDVPITAVWQPLPPAAGGGQGAPDVQAERQRQTQWLERIARGVDALVSKEGIVIEEVTA